MKRIFLLFFAFFNYLLVCGQGNSPQEPGGTPEINYIDESFLPKVMHPSPQAMAFMRYGEIPVSLSTGVPDISIPLYTIQTNGIEIPISISYHASGLKVKDISGIVGLGWVLNAGGMIAQTVYGADDQAFNFQQLENIPFRSALGARAMLEAERERNRRLDKPDYGDFNILWFRYAVGYESWKNFPTIPFHNTEAFNTISDRYSFNFSGHSGVFRCDLSDFTYNTIPYSPLKVEAVGRGFRIIDEQGNEWHFSTGENDLRGETKKDELSVNSTTSAREYYLTTIKFPGQADSVVFSYSQGTPYTLIHQSESIFSGAPANLSVETVSGTCATICNPNSQIQINKYTSSTYSTTTKPVVLDSIKWKNLTISFTYGGNNPDKSKEKLNLIKIITTGSNGHDTVKTIQFHQSGQSRLFLDSLTINNDERYRFYYKGVAPSYDDSGEDFWGYNNGVKHWVSYNGSMKSTLIPFKWVEKGSGNGSTDPGGPGTWTNPGDGPIIIPPLGDTIIPYSGTSHYNGMLDVDLVYLPIREANSFVDGGILTKIVYPTKGSTVFEYEPNKGRDVYDERIKSDQSIDYQFGGLRVKRITNYDNLGNSYWKRYMYYEGGPTVPITVEHFCKTAQFFYLSSRPDCALLSDLNCVIRWHNTAGLGTEKPFTEFGAGTAYYPKVEEIYGTGSKIEGKTEYVFTRDADYGDCSVAYTSKLSVCDNGVITPLLVSKKEYAYNNGFFNLQRETTNSYIKKSNAIFFSGTFTTGVNVSCDYVFSPSLSLINCEHSHIGGFYDRYYNSFQFYDIKAKTRNVVLAKTATTEYTESGKISKTEEYEYSSSSPLLTPSKVISHTLGESNDISNYREGYEESLTHAFSQNKPPYMEMKAKNILAPVVTKSKKILISEGGDPLVPGQEIPDDYDPGESYDIPVYTTKYEYKKSGNLFVIDSVSLSIDNSPLEQRIRYIHYDSYGNPLNVIGADGIETVYIWSYYGQCLIAEIKNISYSTVVGTLSGVTLDGISRKSTPEANVLQAIDNLRNNQLFTDAFITTYTYSPKGLVPLTKTDPNGIKTTFGYDTYNRLQVIKDHMGAIVEYYEHRYAH